MKIRAVINLDTGKVVEEEIIDYSDTLTNKPEFQFMLTELYNMARRELEKDLIFEGR